MIRGRDASVQELQRPWDFENIMAERAPCKQKVMWAHLFEPASKW